jgi:flagellar protein FlgJ
MVRAMRKTVPESDFMAPNMAEKIYREQMDDNFVDSWVDGGGVGLGDMIYDQLMQRYPELKATDKKTLPIQRLSVICQITN